MKRGILCFGGAPYGALQKHTAPVQRLIFNENEPLLPQAQEALWHMRKISDWVCVATECEQAFTALALAAQLPVERLALMGAWMETVRRQDALRRYALRNLSLMVADVLLIGASGREIRTLMRGRRHGALCALEEQSWEGCAGLLTASWQTLAEKNLLNSTKCV